ncbi:MAG: hypothetical protein LLF86_05195 [Nitrospiraceae bacterium]|nr:hypothetical protein [Nitrospiraceae bacterium]
MKKRLRIFELIIAAMFLLMAASAVYAEAEPEEGYDQNIEVSFTGTVSAITETAPVMHGGGFMKRRGPRQHVLLTIKSQNRTYQVITGPVWFMRNSGIAISVGDEIRVTGAKIFGRDGNLYVISKQITITSTGATLVLRDSAGFPVWRPNPRHSQ